MGRLFAVWSGAISAFVLGLLGSLLLVSGHADALDGQLARVRAQLTAQEHAGQQAQASLSRELTAAERALAVAEQRIGGAHRDLITCADWQTTLVITVTGTDSLGGQVAGSGGPPQLPQHCINQ